MAANFNL